jgi:hypothetical protein
MTMTKKTTSKATSKTANNTKAQFKKATPAPVGRGKKPGKAPVKGNFIKPSVLNTNMRDHRFDEPILKKPAKVWPADKPCRCGRQSGIEFCEDCSPRTQRKATTATPARPLATKPLIGTPEYDRMMDRQNTRPTATNLLAQFITDQVDGEVLLNDPLVFIRDAVSVQSGVTFIKYVLRRNGTHTPYGFIYLTERQAQGVGSMIALGVR